MRKLVIVEKPVLVLASRNEWGDATKTVQIYMDDIKKLKPGDKIVVDIPNKEQIKSGSEQSIECIYTNDEGCGCLYRLKRVNLDNIEGNNVTEDPELIWFEFGNKRE